MHHTVEQNRQILLGRRNKILLNLGYLVNPAHILKILQILLQILLQHATPAPLVMPASESFIQKVVLRYKRSP